MNKDIEAQIFSAIGEASMCWSEAPSGVFDDTRAASIAREVVAAIKDALLSNSAAVWDESIAALKYVDGTPFYLLENCNPYRGGAE